MHPIIEQITNQINSNRTNVNNPLLRLLYTLLLIPVNILAKLTELATQPVAIFNNDVAENLRDDTIYLPNDTIGERIKNGYAKIKNTLASILKFPLVLVNALIRAVLFIPKFVVFAPLELIKSAIKFLDTYDKADNALLLICSRIVKLPLDILKLPLELVNNIVHSGFGERFPNLSIAGVLTKIEDAANGLGSFVAKAIVELLALPLTIIVYTGVAAGNAVSTLFSYIVAAVQPNTAPPVVQQSINLSQPQPEFDTKSNSPFVQFSGGEQVLPVKVETKVEVKNFPEGARTGLLM